MMSSHTRVSVVDFIPPAAAVRHTYSFSPSLCHLYSRRGVAPFLDTAAVLDFQTAKPNQLHASFAPRINFAQVFFKNHMYIMGGMKEDREVTNDMWISIDMAQWTFQGNSTWPARQGLGAVVVKDNSGNVSFAWGLFGLALRVCVCGLRWACHCLVMYRMLLLLSWAAWQMMQPTMTCGSTLVPPPLVGQGPGLS